MAKWCILVVFALAVVASARNIPNDGGLQDQKNFLGYGFSGVGSNGLPFAGIGSGFDGGMGGPSGIGGLGGLGGPSGLGGLGGPANGDGPNLPIP
ncbi:hypothetical protein VNO78_21866 [Psophocarpus tetragonolobus]|uniref:Glycine-rich protein n=1 Tax=Psophocarpus tetragonolobus TaxID=3891 RepID=A0AAN9SDD3_PSOTE